MFYIIECYCDFGIKLFSYIKSKVTYKMSIEKILSMSKPKAIQYLNNMNESSFNSYCTRHQRHKLYKLLKGKNSPYSIYSFGPENNLTQKKITIIKDYVNIYCK